MKIKATRLFLRRIKFDYLNRVANFDFLSKTLSCKILRYQYLSKFSKNLKFSVKFSRFFNLFFRFVIFFKLKFLNFLSKDKLILDFLHFNNGVFVKNKIKLVYPIGNFYLFFFNNGVLFKIFQNIFNSENITFNNVFETDRGSVLKFSKEKISNYFFTSFSRKYGFNQNYFSDFFSFLSNRFYSIALILEVHFFIYFFFFNCFCFFSNFLFII